MRKQRLGEVRLRDHFLEEVTLMLEGGEGIPGREFSKSHAAKAGQATHRVGAFEEWRACLGLCEGLIGQGG